MAMVVLVLSPLSRRPIRARLGHGNALLVPVRNDGQQPPTDYRVRNLGSRTRETYSLKAAVKAWRSASMFSSPLASGAVVGSIRPRDIDDTGEP